MSPQQAFRPGTPRTASPAATATQTVTVASIPNVPFGTLRLRAVDNSPAPRQRRRIQWAEDVVDNEGMGKKSSKVCCIYHKPRAVGESSDEESSDSSSSDSDSEPDNSSARPSRGYRPRRPNDRDHQGEDHDHDDCPEGSHDHQPRRSRARRRPSPNAYERMPKPSRKKKSDSGKGKETGQ